MQSFLFLLLTGTRLKPILKNKFKKILYKFTTVWTNIILWRILSDFNMRNVLLLVMTLLFLLLFVALYHTITIYEEEWTSYTLEGSRHTTGTSPFYEP